MMFSSVADLEELRSSAVCDETEVYHLSLFIIHLLSIVIYNYLSSIIIIYHLLLLYVLYNNIIYHYLLLYNLLFCLLLLFMFS